MRVETGIIRVIAEVTEGITRVWRLQTSLQGLEVTGGLWYLLQE